MKLWCVTSIIVCALVVHVHHLESTTAVLGLAKDDVTTVLASSDHLMKPAATTNFVKSKPPLSRAPAESIPEASLSSNYYLNSCPKLEAIIYNKLHAWVQTDYTMAASIIRLHFHDCAVRGCDASILLNDGGGERSAVASRTLRGFEVIDELKSEVEKWCPGTVSCADILTAAARDATVLAGGPFWEVPFGRKDGRVSVAKEAEMVPQGHENVTALIEFFQARGLNVLDLVVLSGSHTIGRSTCYSIRQKLMINGSTDTTTMDPPPAYLNSLRKQCSSSSSSSSLDDTNDQYHQYVDLDATTPRMFDYIYYTNLEKKMGLLLTDQLLYSDPRTAPLVAAFASQPSLFFNQFAVSMVKLGNVQILTANNNQGEVRLNCNHVNP
ncbi:peroxidase [Sarracenia purpurea var. burkii]